MSANVEACLPGHLQGPATTITRIAAGLSGAGVYRVDAGGHTFVLKIAEAGDEAGWRRKARIQQLAASAGVAPQVVHVDEERCAVVSAFVVDRSFPARFGDPRTREVALAQLGQTLRRVHELPVPPDADSREPRAFFTAIWSGLAGFALPAFVAPAVERVLAEEPPACERAAVLSHNDVNPTNLVYDGERLLLLDWDTAGPNDPYYDLAAIAVFLRMDDETCARLLAAYDGAPVTALPPRFAYDRRLIAAMCGSIFLHLARKQGHAGSTGQLDQTIEATLALADVYQRIRAGAFDPATAEGQWFIGLALVKASITL